MHVCLVLMAPRQTGWCDATWEYVVLPQGQTRLGGIGHGKNTNTSFSKGICFRKEAELLLNILGEHC